MMPIRTVLLLSLALAFPVAHAQYWQAKRILEQVHGPVIVARDKSGNETARFQRAWVERAATVLERVAVPMGVSATLFIGKDSSPNAFVTLTKEGKAVMVINTAMLQVVGDDDELMATLIGHELGHLRGEHLTKGAQAQAAINVIGTLLGALVDASQARRGHDTGGLGRTVGSAGAGLVNAKYSRDQEREADGLGMQAMAKAGFDPSGAPRLWRRLSGLGGGGSGLWLDSHPSHAEREVALSAQVAALQPIYAANKPKPAELPAVPDPYPTSQYAGFDPTPEEENAKTAYQQGRAAYVERRYLEAIALLTPVAEEGDERALAMLGGMALTGQGQPVDYQLATKHLTPAADKGFGPAMGALGNMYLTGRGVTKNTSEALKYFVLADKRGYPRAAALLATMYMEGTGVPKDAAFARSLATRASTSKDAFGRAILGVMLRDGVGGSADVHSSFALISGAADAVPWARYQLGVSLERGLGTAADHGKAIDAYKAAAAAGVGPAQSSLKRLNAQ